MNVSNINEWEKGMGLIAEQGKSNLTLPLAIWNCLLPNKFGEVMWLDKQIYLLYSDVYGLETPKMKMVAIVFWYWIIEQLANWSIWQFIFKQDLTNQHTHEITKTNCIREMTYTRLFVKLLSFTTNVEDGIRVTRVPINRTESHMMEEAQWITREEIMFNKERMKE